ncbi:hypothetical protein FISHEDRAFT_41534 [Fistulina hepatica ATCC 64428]|nr:hypothetical protein FISHEDRAFT_41534 [Fistulina hepatica ATCC 64428]
MSRISFPDSMHESGSPAESQDFYGSFSTNASFQMNPLSPHPPRTPRTSIVASSSSARGADMYVPREEAEQLSVDDDSELDEEEDRVKDAEQRVGRADVWREMVATSNGRDKAFKLIQYTIRVFLQFHIRVVIRLLRRIKQTPLEKALLSSLDTAASKLSFARQTLLLFNWLGPLTAIMARQSVPFFNEKAAPKESSKERIKPFLQALLYAPPPVLLDLVNSIADDGSTLAKMGLLGSKFGERAGHISDWCWFLATLVGLVENGVERQMILGHQREVEERLYAESMDGATAKSRPTETKIDDKELARLQKQDYWLQVTRMKLLMDLVFVSYDVFRFKRLAGPVRAVTGLISAILASAKLYDRHKATLVKALLTSSTA